MIQQWRRRDNLIYALSGTAWPYCLSMSAALPENMRGFAFSAIVKLVLFLLVVRAVGERTRACASCVRVGYVDARTCSDYVNVLEAARGK